MKELMRIIDQCLIYQRALLPVRQVWGLRPVHGFARSVFSCRVRQELSVLLQVYGQNRDKHHARAQYLRPPCMQRLQSTLHFGYSCSFAVTCMQAKGPMCYQAEELKSEGMCRPASETHRRPAQLT